MDARRAIEEAIGPDGLGEAGARWFAAGLASGAVSDAQAGAFAMAVRLRGLNAASRTALTLAMRDSGAVLAWDLPGPVIDKHSTGGLGDCVSLPLAPALAVCGGFVPMISGRGLGHTGGTLDKLEAIPGLRVDLDGAALRKQVARLGCAIVSASGEIAPADRRLYAIRDVSGTVESLDLITASILSKKLAAGLEALVLDVKMGSGAFMQTLDEARALAEALCDTANRAGCRTAALITDMNQPLAPALGNALEVAESMAVLEGARGPVRDVTVALGGVLLAQAGLAEDAQAGEARLEEALDTGWAAERFGAMVAGQGGPVDFIEAWAKALPQAPFRVEVLAERAGAVAAIDGRALGMSVVRLGGGRLRDGDRVDPSVGLSAVRRLGERVEEGEALAVVHAATSGAAERAVAEVTAAIRLADEAQPPPLIHARVG